MTKQEKAQQKRERRAARKNPSRYSQWNATPEAHRSRLRYSLFHFPHDSLSQEAKDLLEEEIEALKLSSPEVAELLEQAEQDDPAGQQDVPAEPSSTPPDQENDND